ncbi:protein kinase [Streptomyces sp. NPDC058171]
MSDRYEVTGTLGRGGMGVVYAAVDRELGREVAVKVLPPEFLRESQFRTRFHREARTIARLNHPGIAVLHDIGEDEAHDPPIPFLVMELVRGRTLAEIAAAGRLSTEQAVRITLEILEALEHSHAQGVVHRDVKPSNVMVVGPLAGGTGSRNRVKVLDFGIARLLADTSTRLTATGVSVGTPSYLSPEQADGNGTDARSDLYSVGCLLYELLTGNPPFRGDSPFVVLLAHIQKPPVPPSQLRPGLSPEVDAVVLTALAKRPEDRFADATAMHAALAHALDPSRPAFPSQPPPAAPLPRPATAVDHHSVTAPAHPAPVRPAPVRPAPWVHGAPTGPVPVPTTYVDLPSVRAEPEPPHVRPAGFGQRLGARLIDLVLLSKVALPVIMVLDSSVGPSTDPSVADGARLTFAFAFVYELLGVGLFGRTIGKRLVGLRVVHRTTHRRPGWRALGRASVFWGLLAGLWVLQAGGQWLILVLLVDLMFLLRKRTRHRLLHERASATVVVRA